MKTTPAKTHCFSQIIPCICPVAGFLQTTRQSTLHLNRAAGSMLSEVGMFISLFTYLVVEPPVEKYVHQMGRLPQALNILNISNHKLDRMLSLRLPHHYLMVYNSTPFPFKAHHTRLQLIRIISCHQNSSGA